MKALRPGIVALAVLMMWSLPARAQDAKAAETFVRTLYQHYQTNKDFTPFFDQKTVNALATPELAALVKQDQAISTATGEPGGLDADPVCGSQDPDHVRLDGLEIRLTGPGKAVAAASVHSGTTLIPRRLLLRAVAGKWRIDDITDGKGAGSVRAAILASIKASAPKGGR